MELKEIIELGVNISLTIILVLSFFINKKNAVNQQKEALRLEKTRIQIQQQALDVFNTIYATENNVMYNSEYQDLLKQKEIAIEKEDYEYLKIVNSYIIKYLENEKNKSEYTD